MSSSTVCHELEAQLRRCYASAADARRQVTVPQLQEGSSDCGLFAIATAFNIASNVDVNSVRLDQPKMRRHLVECFERDVLTEFPRRRDTAKRVTDGYSCSLLTVLHYSLSTERWRILINIKINMYLCTSVI